MIRYFDGLVQDCSNSIALAMELLQSCTKPSIFILNHFFFQDGGEGYFAIAGAASEGFIVLQQPLDYDEGQRQYALNVTVRVSENKNYSALPRRVPLTHWLLGDVEAILQEYLFNSFHELITKSTSREISLRWAPENHIAVKSTLVWVMACCYQATSHYLNQCWPRSMTSYGVTGPQWVKCNLKVASHKG